MLKQTCNFLFYYIAMSVSKIEKTRRKKKGKQKEWCQRYLHKWGYGKYVTRIPDVVSYEIYEWHVL